MLTVGKAITASHVFLMAMTLLAQWASAQPPKEGGLRFDLGPSFFDLYLGDTRLAFSEGDPLVVLLYSEASDIWQARSWRMVAPDSPSVSRDGDTLTYSAQSFEGLPIRLQAVARVDQSKGEILWNITIENGAPGTVVGLIGPCMRNVQDRPGGFLAVPNRAGHRIDDPWNTLAGAIQQIEYPVPASMQYLAYSGAGGGLAVHVFDPAMTFKHMAFGGDGRQMTFIQYPFIAAGGSWQSPPVLWQALTTDWHAAADRYGTWFRSWAHSPLVSPRIKARPYVPGVVILARPVDDEFLKDVTKEQEKKTYMGAIPEVERLSNLDGIHLVGWFGQGHDTTYPDHWPSEAMGDKEDLLKLVGRVHENDDLAVYYLNARLLNITSDSYKAHPDWAAKIPPEGNPREEKIGGAVFNVACPDAPGYQEHMKNEVLRVASEYKGDGVQLDQVGAAWSVLCYDASHGHKNPATAWAEGHTRMLADIYNSVRKIDPDFFCWIEGAWEGAGQYVDLSQGGFWPDHPGSKPFPQMYRYTLPEHPLFGDARMGGVPYWCPSDTGRDMRITKKAAPFFWDGDFRDDIGLTVDQGGEAHWFSLKDKLLLTVFNPSQEQKTLRLSLALDEIPSQEVGQPLPWIGQMLSDDVEIPVTIEGGNLTMQVTVPAGQVEAVIVHENKSGQPLSKTP